MVVHTTLIQTTFPDALQRKLIFYNVYACNRSHSISIGLTGLILEYIGADILFLIIVISSVLGI